MATDPAITEARRLGDTPVTWESAALRLGEELGKVGPHGYYRFTPEQWLAWTLPRLAVLLTATGAAEARVTILEQERDTLTYALRMVTHERDNLRTDHDAIAARLAATEEVGAETMREKDTFAERLYQAQEERDALQAQLTAARAYMQHKSGCGANACAQCGFPRHNCQGLHVTFDWTPQACSCGLDAALPPTPEET